MPAHLMTADDRKASEAASGPRRYCRWVDLGDREAAEHLAEGRSVPLLVCVPRAGGDSYAAVYYTRLVFDPRGRIQEIEMSKTYEDGSGFEAYRIDCGFGPRPEHWSCSCPHESYRRRRSGPCKHVLAVAAALRKVGLLD